MNTVQAAVTKLRHDLRLNQLEFGKLLQVGPVTVSRWENGRPVSRRCLDRLVVLAITREDTVSATLFRMARPPEGRRMRAARRAAAAAL